MPSDESKPVKKEDLEGDLADEKSLSSLLESRKKKLSSSGNNASAVAKLKAKKVEPKHEEDDVRGKKSGDIDKKSTLGSGSKVSRVKKEEKDIEDEDDRKPIRKNNASTTPKTDNKVCSIL